MTEHEKPAANVVEALSRVMGELPAIGKDSKADPKQGGYAYRGIEAITTHTQSLFAKHGIVFTPHVLSYEVRDITVNSKPWTDVYELIEYSVYGPGGAEDCIKVGPVLAIGRDNSDKGANKCMTQAFKYALLQALCISDAKDDGDSASVEAEHTQPTGITSEELFDRLTQYVAGRISDPDGEHAKGAWKAAKPKKAEDGRIYETEVDRVIAEAERYVVDLEELNPPEQPELAS